MSGAGQSASVRVFISYSTKDADLVQRLKDGLARAGVDVWLDHERLTVGTPNWQRAIRDGIAQASHVIYVASEIAAESPYVYDEISLARGKGKQVIPFWARGESWYKCAPLGWGATQYVDGRGDRFGIGLSALLHALGVGGVKVRPEDQDQPLPSLQVEEADPLAKFETIINCDNDQAIVAAFADPRIQSLPATRAFDARVESAQRNIAVLPQLHMALQNRDDGQVVALWRRMTETATTRPFKAQVVAALARVSAAKEAEAVSPTNVPIVHVDEQHHSAPHVFISYSTIDRAIVDPLKDRLGLAGVDVWLDHERLTSDTLDWHSAIRTGIAQATHVIYAASESAAHSRFVIHELEIARGKKKHVICFWVRGAEWYDCTPLGWFVAQRIDARDTNFEDGLSELLRALGS